MSATPPFPASHNAATQSQSSIGVWRRRAMLATVQILGWICFAAIAALTSLNDDLRMGFDPDYWPIFVEWSYRATAMALTSIVIWLAFARWPQVYASARNLVFGFAILMLCLLPMQLLFVVKDLFLKQELIMSWEAFGQQLSVINRLAGLLQITSIAAIYLAVAAIKLWQQNQERRHRWEQERADVLALKLELEQQKMLALRSQLEPHFMFNALNAISALVMQDNRDNALDGINGLSELLRYALTASEKNWVTIAEEMQFVEDYLQLQQLRYGKRLQFHSQGLSAEMRQIVCPPLLLQPLIENAIRHDLDNHQDASDIQLLWQVDESNLYIYLSNSVHDENAAQTMPSTGLGLRNTRARLQMAYGERASLITSIKERRFHAHLCIPKDAQTD
ncbi:histidine kinase [Undibacterium sp. LX40W]|uniref:Histidine kinase n=1 Tax=Undibacterium nitidum TaxID=2762298 RepID=A0A923HWI0_9BURK|nr:MULTISPECIES: histidine kinase [Undibacterium]MBC3882684.1 histidine kinase [Undibacterium nitidum]MBC3892965.1 histidine kinase [Undibacterium sp. LX40W]